MVMPGFFGFAQRARAELNHRWRIRLTKLACGAQTIVMLAGPLELAKGWGELRAAIWKRDLGDARAKRLDEATRRITEQRMRASE